MTEHQKVLLSMLKDLDNACRKHHISYMLFSGTALGAVRHQGFIPWDDDLDIIMLRDEYERFFRTATCDFDPQKYYIQQEFSDHWPMQFSKLRLNGTTCMEKYHPKDEEVHQGVYLDIFPCDNLSDHRFVRGMQFLASKIVIAKSLYERGYETDNLLKKIFMQISRMMPKELLWSFCLHRSASDSGMVHSFFGASSRYKNSVYPRTWFTQTVNIQFEDSIFPISACYDGLLSRLYGDYRKLPKPEQRKCKEHAVILDLRHPYTEHLEEQRTMKIDTYTRSIR